MAKTKTTKKKEYGFLTREQASLVWKSEKPKPENLVKTGDKAREKFSSTSIVSDPEMWPSLADALLMQGVEAKKELDFGKLAEHFNEIIKGVTAGQLSEPRPLTGGVVRKLALDLTRERLADAKAILVTKPTDAGAQAMQKEARDILAKHGWEETAVKREKKAEEKAGKATKTTPNANPVEPVKPVAAAKVETQEPTPAKKSAAVEPVRYYITGDTKPVKEELKKIGGQYEPKITSWWFSSEEAQAKGQKIVDNFNGGTK